MELPIIRACAAGVAAPTIGLNAMIDQLVLDKSGDVRPAHVTIYNSVDDAWVSNKLLQMEEVRNGMIALPGLAVYFDQPLTLDAEVGTTSDGRDAEAMVVFSYLSAEPASVKELRDALYVNWAMLRFLTLFNANSSTAKTLRTRGSITLYRCLKVDQPLPPFSPFGEVSTVASTVVTFKVRESSP